MSKYSLTHLSDQTLLHDLSTLVARDRATTSELLAHLAEVDARKLYLPAAYPSMYAYCVGELRMSEDSACKRIRAARAARTFPAIFNAIAEGRLSLSAVVVLAPHLTSETASELMAAAEHKTKFEIEQLLAARHPRPDVPTRLDAIGLPVDALADNPPPAAVEPSAPGRIEESLPRPRIEPLAPERFALQVTINQSTHDKLRYAQALLSHQVASGDVAAVLDRVLDGDRAAREAQVRGDVPAAAQRASPESPHGRHVPAEVRRAVWERDGGRCTFVSETGQRCPARSMLEFDHVHEAARGGVATISGMRLRCRAHNQYTAERTYGAEFMRHKREAARAGSATAVAAPGATRHDVTPWLRRLGFSSQEARRAAAHCESMIRRHSGSTRACGADAPGATRPRGEDDESRLAGAAGARAGRRAHHRHRGFGLALSLGCRGGRRV